MNQHTGTAAAGMPYASQSKTKPGGSARAAASATYTYVTAYITARSYQTPRRLPTVRSRYQHGAGDPSERDKAGHPWPHSVNVSRSYWSKHVTDTCVPGHHWWCRSAVLWASGKGPRRTERPQASTKSRYFGGTLRLAHRPPGIGASAYRH